MMTRRKGEKNAKEKKTVDTKEPMKIEENAAGKRKKKERESIWKKGGGGGIVNRKKRIKKENIWKEEIKGKEMTGIKKKNRFVDNEKKKD